MFVSRVFTLEIEQEKPALLLAFLSIILSGPPSTAVSCSNYTYLRIFAISSFFERLILPSSESQFKSIRALSLRLTSTHF